MVSRHARLAKRLAASALLTLTLGVVVGEGLLRVRGTFLTYDERNYGAYEPYVGREIEGWLRTWKPGERQGFETSEFEHVVEANSDGLRDLEREPAKPPGCSRIVVLGDSFAEGVGAPIDRSWPRQLEAGLVAEGHDVEVFNAGISGSDPFFEYQLLVERLLKYEPDLVVVAVNVSDIQDVLLWGGMERFCEDGMSRSLPATRLEPFYRRSHLARFFIHRLLKLDRRYRKNGGLSRPRENLAAQLSIVDALKDFQRVADEEGFGLWVLLHPTPNDLEKNPQHFWAPFRERLDELGIEWLDLQQDVKRAVEGLDPDVYGWPVDRHYTPRGYEILAGVVQDALLAGPGLPAPAD